MQRWLLAAGVVLGIVTVILLNLYISSVESRESGLTFLRLKTDIDGVTRGERLKEDWITTEQLPKRFEGLAQVVVRDDEHSRAFLLSRPVNRDLNPGMPLLYEYFADPASGRFAADIPVNKRAIAIPVGSVSAVGFLIEPGSLVDVIGTFPRPGDSAGDENASGALLSGFTGDLVTKTILQAVKVLAVDRMVSHGGYLDLADSGFRSVTLEVTPDQAEILTFALGEVKGGLTLSLRNPKDSEKLALPAKDWRDLFPAAELGVKDGRDPP